MKFRTKLFAIYAVFMLVVTVVIGSAYYSINYKTVRYQEEQSLEFFANQMSVRFDDIFTKMEYGINFLMSDMNVLDNLILLSNSRKNKNFPEVYKNEAKSAILKSLNSYFVKNNFYRVIIFNTFGDVLVSNDLEEAIIDNSIHADDIQWLDKVTGKKNKSILVGNHPDDWGLKYNPEVISLVKEIQGMSLGYIEVQLLVDTFIRDLDWVSEDYEMLLIQSDGGVLYSSKGRKDCSYYISIMKDMSDSVGKYYNPETGETELIAAKYSEYADVTVLMIENETIIKSKELLYIYYTIAACALFGGLSMLFVWGSSNYLARPIKRMQHLMEQTELENMNQNILIDKSSDEMEALYGTYQGLMERLSEAMQKEKESSLLQVQAMFDTLQAQVNPHFIYNVLNVISNKGMMLEDESICEICTSLATMLRYSTNTKERFATIGAEIMYLEQYGFLIKARYKHRFEYEYTIDNDIVECQIPKLTLQQLIENSIYHGFHNSTEIMKIKIKGWLEDCVVYLRVHDNGQGFAEEEIQKLEDKFEQVRLRYRKSTEILEMEIGGMGLVNTYARLYLIYGENLSFCIRNEGGAEITIGIRIKDNSLQTSEGRKSD
jgi:two-component system, sensor histidine kinase YesM